MTISGNSEVTDSESAATVIERWIQRRPIDYERRDFGTMDEIFPGRVDLRIELIVIFHPFGEVSVLQIETSVNYSDNWFVRRHWNRGRE